MVPSRHRLTFLECSRQISIMDSIGLGRGGGVGLAVGLFAPPLLASVAVGAVAGGVIGEFAGYRVEQDIHGHSDS